MPYRIVRLDRTASTMIDAAAHPPGTVVVAEEQTAGQGRLGRKWHSERGAGLYCSIVLDLPEADPIVTLALGLATREAIEKTAGVTCDLRWPNDVLISDRKCAGILVQLHDIKVIAGIGVNVNHTSFPPELAGLATSLRLVTGKEHSKEELLKNLLGAVEGHTQLDRDEILRLFAHASSYVSGRRVIVAGQEGTTDGLDDSGYLWLRTADGRRTLLRAGDVRPCGG